jgi:lysozyme
MMRRFFMFLLSRSGAVSVGTARWLAICATFTGSAEGLRLIAYMDPVGIPTICFGETKGVKLGDRMTAEQCKGLLISRLIEFDAGLTRCFPALPHQPDRRRAALVSWAYNVGLGAACNSTLIRLANAGRTRSACDQLPRWDKARVAGVLVSLPGLTKRRAEEKALCLTDL